MNFLLVIHLLQNVVLAEWAPLLLVLSIPPALAATLTRSAAARTLTHPAVALPIWLANYMVWHLPWLYDTALEHPHSLLHLEHALYFATGVAMWWSVLQDEPHRLGPGVRAGVVFAAFVLGSPIGLVIALVPEAIYDFYVDAPERLWGLTALEDQRLAGILMSVEQAIVFFAVFAYFFFRFLAEEERREDVEHAGEAGRFG
jgi:putative membrane protein